MHIVISGAFTPIKYFDSGFEPHLGRFAAESMCVRRTGPVQRSADWDHGYVVTPVEYVPNDFDDFPF